MLKWLAFVLKNVFMLKFSFFDEPKFSKINSTGVCMFEDIKNLVRDLYSNKIDKETKNSKDKIKQIER